MNLFRAPWPEAERRLFLDHYFYRPEAFLVDEITAADTSTRVMRGSFQTDRPLLVAPFQKIHPDHPAHVSGADMIMMTVSLGSLHAYFFHRCLWHEGWVGFGSRMENVEFRNLAVIGPPMALHSREIKTRVGPKRCILEFEFQFEQEGKTVYRSQQTAMFVKNHRL